MMTVRDIKNIYGDDVILLFKGIEPFTEIKKDIPAGVLIENNEGKVVCYICGKWFEQLSTHLRSHNRTTKSYKEEYNFNVGTSLCSRAHSQKQSLAQLKIMTLERLSLMREALKKKKQTGRPKGSYMKMQEKNRRNTCPEQIKRRLELLVNKYGITVSINQAREVDEGVTMFAFRNYGGWNNFKEKFGLSIDISSLKKKRADLIYDLRLFVKDNKRLPWSRVEFRNKNFPHSKSPYIREFGSMRKTKIICGIKKGNYSSYYLWN